MRRSVVSTVVAPEQFASDIDALSLQFAHDNVRTNGLESRIRIFHGLPNGPILESLFEDETFRCGSLAKGRRFVLLKYPRCDFSMCNPPFYSSKEDIQQSAESKEFDPHAVRLVPRIVLCIILMEALIGMYWRRRGDDNRRGRGRLCWTNLGREHTGRDTLQVRRYLK